MVKKYLQILTLTASLIISAIAFQNCGVGFQVQPPPLSSFQLKSFGAPSTWVSGFYAGYNAGYYPPSAVDYKALTHVMVFSVMPIPDGAIRNDISPQIAMEVARRAHAAGKKAIITLGGGVSETVPGFRGATRPEVLSLFVRNILNLVDAWDMDGVDIDWEPLYQATESDFQQYFNLVEALRKARPALILTVDIMGFNINTPTRSFEADFYRRVAPLLDQMNIMTYDMAGTFQGWVLTHNSPLFGEASNHPISVKTTIERYMSFGIPASKLGMGIAFYGNCWKGPVSAPYQNFNGASMVCGDNLMSYRNIKTQYYTSSNAYYDSTSQNPFLSFLEPAGACGCNLISYEDETSVRAKGDYAKSIGLGGTIIWELSEGYIPGDPDPQRLLKAVGEAFSF